MKESEEVLRSDGCGNGGLLVDFPSNCNMNMLHHNNSNSSIDARDDEEDLASGSGPPSSETFKSKKPQLTVRFAKKSMMTFIEYPSHSELRRRWDTKAEVDMYKRKLVQERNYISRKLASTSQIETDDLILCIGMEKILSINVCKEVKRRQKQHVRSILEEQARQELCNVVDVEALSRLSQNNSKWTNSRSHKLADGYWKSWKVDNDIDQTGGEE